MKKINYKSTTSLLTLFALLLVFIPGSSIAAETDSANVIKKSNILMVEGKIKRFNSDSQTVLLQLKTGEKLSILIDWNTALVGYASPSEIEKGNKVKIWHSTGNNTTTAIKIEKKLMVGC